MCLSMPIGGQMLRSFKQLQSPPVFVVLELHKGVGEEHPRCEMSAEPIPAVAPTVSPARSRGAGRARHLADGQGRLAYR